MLIFLPALHGSSECLQIGARRFVAHSAIFARVLCAHIGGLRIHNLKHRCFAAGVAQLGQAQALCGGSHALIERGELIVRCLRFRISFVEPRNQLALRGGERDPGSVAPDFALFDFVLGGEPVPHR